jgi:hypothetical protein
MLPTFHFDHVLSVNRVSREGGEEEAEEMRGGD